MSEHTEHLAGHHAESLNHTAFSATVHCLTGCAIGEILGLVLGTAFGWANGTTIAASIALAFFFGYSLTMLPLLRADLSLRQALPLAFASDTLSIATMELLDTLTVLVIPRRHGRRAGRPAVLGLAGRRVVHRLLGRLPGQPLAHRPRQRARGHARLPLTVRRNSAYDVGVLVVLALAAFVLLVGLLTWKAPKRVQIRSCCSARPWPPDDLTGPDRERHV